MILCSMRFFAVVSKTMSIEIERKYLIADDGWQAAAAEGVECRQGYLVSDEQKTVRIRIMGDRGYLTVKGATRGLSRKEFEYQIDLADAVCMLELCENIVEKTRYTFRQHGMIWEVDVFTGENAGLVMAEVELESEEQQIELPDWVGKEVSGDPRYYNACLAQHPYSTW